MGTFGDISLANKFGIILGSLIAVVFAAGLVRLYVNKKRLRKNQRIADQEQAGKTVDREKLVPKTLGAGDLFGVRAIEAGYFGGISQPARPNSPATSYKLSPSTSLTDWGKSERSGSPLDQINEDVITPPTSLPLAKKKPSPLRLTPFGEDLKPAAGFGNGTYLSPLSSPRSFRSGKSGMSGKSTVSAWVSPLDVHFSRPTTPGTSEKERPTSYLPRKQFPEATGKDSISLSSPNAFNFDLKPGPKSTPEPLKLNSSSSSQNITVPPTPRSPSYFPPMPRSPSLPGVNRSLAAENERWNSVSALVRDSLVSKRTVSVYRPKSMQNQSPDAAHFHGRPASGASSIYSHQGSILDEDDMSRRHETRGSHSSKENTEQTSRSRSTSQERSRSSSSRAGTQDSLPRNSRKNSSESLNNGRGQDSRERNLVHYNANNQDESPFSNTNAITTSSHSVNSSISTSSANIPSRSPHREAIPRPTLGLTIPEPDRLSVMTTGAGRNRSASEASQGSIGDFYDSYYRLSTMGQRASVAPQTSTEPSVRQPPPLDPRRLGGETVVEQQQGPGPRSMFPANEEGFPGMI